MYPTSFKISLVPFKEDSSSLASRGGSGLPDDILEKISTISTSSTLRASPCSDPRAFSSSPENATGSLASSPLSRTASSPVGFSDDVALVQPRFNSLHDRSFVIKKRVACGELMSDIEAAAFFISGAKISLPPRIGIIRALLPIYQKYETPTGFKSKIVFTLAEKKCAYMSRPTPEANLIQILFRQRFSVLQALKQLLNDAQKEALPSFEMISYLSTYKTHLSLEHENFLEYFNAIQALRAETKCLLRSNNLTPKVFNEIQRNTHHVADAYASQFIDYLPKMLNDSDELTIDIAQNLVKAKPANVKRIEELLRTIKMATSSKKTHFQELRSIITNTTSRLIEQEEPLNTIQIAYLEDVFKHFNTICGKTEGETISAYDLEILKAKALPATRVLPMTALEVFQFDRKAALDKTLGTF